MDDELKVRIIDLFDGKLTPAEEKETVQQAIQAGFDKLELEQIREMYQLLGELPVPEPGEEMSLGFHKEMDRHIRKKSVSQAVREKLQDIWQKYRFSNRIPRFGYAFGLLFLGWAVGYWGSGAAQYDKQLSGLSAEVREMKEVVALSMLSDYSASKRLRALHSIKRMQQADPLIIQAVINILIRDNNNNVRLTALETLLEYPADPAVRQGLVVAINHQQSPLLQLALVEALVSMEEKTAAEPLKHLLNRQNLHHSVRQKIERALAILI